MRTTLLSLLFIFYGLSSHAQIVYTPFIPQENPPLLLETPKTSPHPRSRPNTTYNHNAPQTQDQLCTTDFAMQIAPNAQHRYLEVRISVESSQLFITHIRKQGQWVAKKISAASISSILNNESMNSIDPSFAEFLSDLPNVADFIAIDLDTLYVFGIHTKQEDYSKPNESSFADLKITRAYLDNENLSEIYKNSQQYIHLYKNDGKLFISNVGDSGESYGNVFYTNISPVDGGVYINGQWHYRNTYDSLSGYASVLIFLNQNGKFKMEIGTEDQEYMILQGDIEKWNFN